MLSSGERFRQGFAGEAFHRRLFVCPCSLSAEGGVSTVLGYESRLTQRSPSRLRDVPTRSHRNAYTSLTSGWNFVPSVFMLSPLQVYLFFSLNVHFWGILDHFSSILLPLDPFLATSLMWIEKAREFFPLSRHLCMCMYVLHVGLFKSTLSCSPHGSPYAVLLFCVAAKRTGHTYRSCCWFRTVPMLSFLFLFLSLSLSLI